MANTTGDARPVDLSLQERYGRVVAENAALRAQLYACSLDRAAARAEVARLRSVMRKYAGHVPMCAVLYTVDGATCDCGWTSARREVLG